MNPLRLLQTLRHLRPRQVGYQLYYRTTGRLATNYAAAPAAAVVPQDAPALPPEAAGLPARQTGPARFTFLNRTVDFGAAGRIDWNYAALGKLWTYNLNYFEYLRQADTDPAVGQALISAWVAAEATHRDGWEPYPTSLRLVNWGQFYRTHGLTMPPEVRASLGRQVYALTRSVEYHLDGNHLLENALALAYAGRAYGLPRVGRRGDRLLTDQLERQYLADGAHYELSPMYQYVLLWRQLDLCSVLGPDDPLRPALRSSVEQQLGWARALGNAALVYPHFNDSTPGVAPDPAATFAYAGALGLSTAAGRLGASGYRRWSWGATDAWLDAAAIGPDHIPGHAHADNLTFVLHHAGRPLVVDPAVSTYEKNARRHWERSTAAHNTVTPAGGGNTSDVWGGFRVGERSYTTVEREVAGRELTAVRRGRGSEHRRTWRRDGGSLTIVDEAAGGTARLHFAHDQTPLLTAHGLSCGPLNLSWTAARAVRLTDYEQATGFNERRPARCLEIDFTDRLTTVFTFTDR